MSSAIPAHRRLRTTDYRALAELRYRIRRFLHFSEEAARRSGLEPQQHQLLLAVKGLPDGHRATIAEIAERLQLAHNSAQELVRRAERRALLRTHRGQEDRREVIVELTEDGDAALRDLTMAHLAELDSEAPALAAALQALAPGGGGR